LQLWNLAEGEAVGQFDKLHTIQQVAFSHDGKWLAAGGRDGKVFLFDAETGKQHGDTLEHRGAVRALAFTPDGRFLVSGSADGTARQWDVSAGRAVGPAIPTQGEVTVLTISQDGRRLLVGGTDRMARLWDLHRGEAISPPLEHADELTALAFSAGGDLVVTGSADQAARLWDARTGTSLGPPFRLPGVPLAVGFDHEAGEVLTLSWDGGDRTSILQRRGSRWERTLGTGADATFRRWPISPPAEGPPTRVTAHVEAITGMRLDKGDVARALVDAELAAARTRARRTSEEVANWHRHRSEDALRQGQWHGARWHLNHLIQSAPKRVEWRSRRARALVRLGDLDAASSDANDALRVDPDDATALHVRGEVRSLRGDWKGSLPDLARAVELDRHDAEKWHDLGTSRAQSGQWKEAEQAFARGGELMPRQVGIASDLAVLAARSDPGRWRQACKGLLQTVLPPSSEKNGDRPRQVTQIDYGEAGAVSRVTVSGGSTRTITDLGNAGGLTQSVQQSRSGTTSRFSPMLAGHVAWVCCLHQLEKPEAAAALALARAAHDRQPGYVLARAVAACRLRAGETNAARDSLMAILESRKDPSPSVWLLLALTQYRLKEAEKAQPYLDRAERWVEASKKLGSGRDGETIGWRSLNWREQVMLELLLTQAKRAKTDGASR
jgi:Flp pilus assembly protein TadD